jgi:hypothetical protein
MKNETLIRQTKERMFQEPGVPAQWVCDFYLSKRAEVPCTTAAPHRNIWCQFYTQEELVERLEAAALAELDNEIPRPDVPPIDELRNEVAAERRRAYSQALLELANV